jgi:O-antigen/teichoic acid export membrane protein
LSESSPLQPSATGPSEPDAIERQGLAARLPLPEGTLPVAFGLLIAGVASYAFFKVGVWALGEADFAPISKLWFATFALAPGVFLPLEQEVGRALAHRRALGIGGRPVVHKVALLGAGLVAIVSLLIVLFGNVIAHSYFNGNWVMVVALVLAVASYAPAHLSRGICSGTGRFHSYAIVMGADGVVRIAACAALAIAGVKLIGPYGLVVALAPLLGVFYIVSRGRTRTQPGPEASWNEVTPNLGWLLIGSMLAAGLVNAGPIATGLLASDDQEALVTRFGYGVLLSRVPLFMFQAVQAALLPRLARLAARGDLDEFRRGFRRLMMVVIVVGSFGTLVAWAIGPFAIDLVYDAELGRTTLAMLALGSAFYMVGLAAAQAVIALHGHALVALGWAIGMTTFVLATAFSSDELFRRVEIGLAAGSFMAMVTFLIELRIKIHAGAVADEGSILEAVTDIPFEG